MGVLSKHLHEVAPALSTFDGKSQYAVLDSVVARCLEKDPALRYRNMSEVSQELRMVRALTNSDAPPPRAPRSAQGAFARRVAWVAGLGLLVGGGAVVALWNALGVRQVAESPGEAPSARAELSPSAAPSLPEPQAPVRAVTQPSSRAPAQENANLAVDSVNGSGTAAVAGSAAVLPTAVPPVAASSTAAAPAKTAAGREPRPTKTKREPFRRTSEIVNPWSK